MTKLLKSLNVARRDVGSSARHTSKLKRSIFSHTQMSHKLVSGSALALTMLTIAALITLSLGMATVVPRDYRDSLAFESSLTAETNAWSGVEQGLYSLKVWRQHSEFYELSSQKNQNPSNYPRGVYNVVGSSNCYLDRTACPALDRALGEPQNQFPVQFGDIKASQSTDVLSSPGSAFSLLVWHERDRVGNPQDLYDFLPRANDNVGNSANINPVLQRDEVRRLDATHMGTANITWETVHRPQSSGGCNAQSDKTHTYIVATVLDKDNNILHRAPVSEGNPGNTITITNPDPSKSFILSLRYLVTNDDQKQIEGCYARYRITDSSPTASVDLGYDVVESTGKSGNYQRKLRVQIDRENGRPLNIFDFGLVCQQCEGIQ